MNPQYLEKLAVNVNNFCGRKCEYCFPYIDHSAPKKEMSIETADAFIDFCAKNNVKRISINHREPLISDITNYLVRSASERLEVDVQTGLNDISKFTEWIKVRMFWISYDGMFQSTRHQPNTSKNILELKKKGCKFALMWTVTHENLPGIYENCMYLSKFTPDKICLNFDATSLHRITSSDVPLILDQLDRVKKEGIRVFNFMPAGYAEQPSTVTFCRKVAVGLDGNIYLCNTGHTHPFFIDLMAGNVIDGINEAAVEKRERMYMELEDKIEKKPYVRTCILASLHRFGQIQVIPEQQALYDGMKERKL